MSGIVLVIFGVMILLMILNAPIGFALICCTFAGVIFSGSVPPMVVAQRLFVGMDSFTLIAVPLFILTGQFMALGGITRDLMNLSSVFVGHLRGGLAYINIVASMIFAGITGSASTDTSSLGSILIPAMVEKGYEKDFTVAVTATSSTIGIMIPPSIPMVLYGVATNASIGKLFMAGVIPGILVGLALMGVTAVLTKKRNYPREGKIPFKQKIVIILKSIPSLMAIVIIIGGVVSGFFTPTEAAGVASVYTFLLGVFYYKELYIKNIPKIFTEVALTMGLVALMISSASALGWVLTNLSVPRAIATAILSATESKVIVLLLINLLLLFVGTWMDLTPSTIILSPILLPLALHFGIDPVHFGIIMVVNLAIGLFTPPVGLCLFIACGIAKVQMADVLKAFIPFFVVMLAALLLITYVPLICMFLPNFLMQ
jgi:C4-dicarboxylate transporter DctM subunit